uniref:Uncharacterized protein n=1 Tax=Timema douglasi TaxID=61478 RepID=A0A7R8W1S5_TIMDO|nr:unnamed protein product [Timema douglasi]
MTGCIRIVYLCGAALTRGLDSCIGNHVTKCRSDLGHEGWQCTLLEVLVDHFSFADNNTFQLKYLINDTYWKQDGGPIFFYTGNEGAIEVFAENTVSCRQARFTVLYRPITEIIVIC